MGPVLEGVIVLEHVLINAALLCDIMKTLKSSVGDMLKSCKHCTFCMMNSLFKRVYFKL